MRSISLAILFCCLSQSAAGAYDASTHAQAQIVRDALSSTLNENNLNLVVSSLEAQAVDKNMLPAALFGPTSFKNSVSFIDREQKKVLNHAAEADVSAASRYFCLKHFGQLLFVAQDFYSRSDYVEVQAAALTAKFGKDGFNPYNIDLVDWNVLNNDLRTNHPLPYGPARQTKETAEQGSAALGNTTYFKTARELAVRETAHQWELLESLIKHRFPNRALTILTALREASCPVKEPDSLD